MPYDVTCNIQNTAHIINLYHFFIICTLPKFSKTSHSEHISLVNTLYIMNAILGPKSYHFFIKRTLISEQPLTSTRSRRCSLYGGLTVWSIYNMLPGCTLNLINFKQNLKVHVHKTKLNLHNNLKKTNIARKGQIA